jgi:hypothetical protein
MIDWLRRMLGMPQPTRLPPVRVPPAPPALTPADRQARRDAEAHQRAVLSRADEAIRVAMARAGAAVVYRGPERRQRAR